MQDEGIEVVDVVQEPEGIWARRFTEAIAQLRVHPSRDKLIQNYLDLDSTFTSYEAFHLILREQKIVGFCAMQGGRFPKPISRVMTRLYYFEDVREKSLASHLLPGLASKFVLPKQIEFARRLGKKAVFFSFLGLNRRKFTLQMAQCLNEFYAQDWVVPEGLFYTGRRWHEGDQVVGLREDWQNVAILKLDPSYEFPLPHITIEEWQRRFGIS